MDIVTIIMIVVIGFIVLAIAGGFAFWIYLSMRPKKMTWKAKIYQIGDGEIKYLDKYRLGDLKTYTEDIIEKIDKKNGATHYWLQKMKKAVPVVTADCVEVWGPNKKEVKVLLQEDTCTLLKAGYDKNIGEIIFRPTDHDRINMIKTELSERKERIQNQKDILAALAPYFAISAALIALVIAIYIIVQGALESAENNREGSALVASSVNKLSDAMLIVYGYSPQDLNTSDTREVKKEDPPLPMPP